MSGLDGDLLWTTLWKVDLWLLVIDGILWGGIWLARGVKAARRLLRGDEWDG